LAKYIEAYNLRKQSDQIMTDLGVDKGMGLGMGEGRGMGHGFGQDKHDGQTPSAKTGTTATSATVSAE